MRENPVKKEIVPPICSTISSTFAAVSMVILSNVGLTKYILTNLKLFFHLYSEEWELDFKLINDNYVFIPFNSEGNGNHFL